MPENEISVVMPHNFEMCRRCPVAKDKVKAALALENSDPDVTGIDGVTVTCRFLHANVAPTVIMGGHTDITVKAGEGGQKRTRNLMNENVNCPEFAGTELTSRNWQSHRLNAILNIFK